MIIRKCDICGQEIIEGVLNVNMETGLKYVMENDVTHEKQIHNEKSYDLKLSECHPECAEAIRVGIIQAISKMINLDRGNHVLLKKLDEILKA